MANQSANFHAEYMDVIKHWSPTSEKYAGGDALLTLINDGWTMQRDVVREPKWFAEMRHIDIFHITLEREGEILTVPVIYSPHVSRMMKHREVHVTVKQDTPEPQKQKK